MDSSPWVYRFRDGNAEMRDLLGGKGANLAEMTNADLPVPPGFTITTEACNAFLAGGGTLPEGLWEQALAALHGVEEQMERRFADPNNPLLVSVRSGAKFSMPGMMDTILNLGLNDQTVRGLAAQAEPRFAYDCYRRLIQMFGKVVLDVDAELFEDAIDRAKRKLRVQHDHELPAGALQELVGEFKEIVRRESGRDFPSDPHEQLRQAIVAVFDSWNNRRAIDYRRANDIPDDLGTAVNVQTMVYGNMGPDCATGVCFTRNPNTGEPGLFGEYLVNAQGEDVVAGVRTPQPVQAMDDDPLLRPAYQQLLDIAQRLERHYRDMQDLEFTVQNGTLWMLQTRTGKRTGKAAVEIAVDLAEEGVIDRREAVARVEPGHLDQLLHPMIDHSRKGPVIATGLPASPGAASGKVVFNADQAKELGDAGEAVILVRTETSPEDFHGMLVSRAVLTARGGMTCLAGETRILTDRGMFSAEDAFHLLLSDPTAELRILSFESRALRPVWRRVIAAGQRPSEVITVAVSQTGRANQNVLRLTADHKMLIINQRQLAKKRLDAVLADADFLTVIDHIPALQETATSTALAYVAGAILSDGYISLKPTKGSVTFVQKPTPEKASFIASVEQAFEEAFTTPLRYVRKRSTVGVLSGREIRGAVEDRICYRRAPAALLAEIRDNLTGWVLTLDELALLHFLAGFVDGDGTFAATSSEVRLQISVSGAKSDLLEGIALACLRLGIVPQITSNRENFAVQIAERVDDILAMAHRVSAEIRPRLYESKCLTVKGMFDDIVEQVNYMGRVREGIKRNLMFGVEKLRRDVLPLCFEDTSRQVEALLDAPLRSHRVSQVGGPQPAMVYNFEVDADDELDKNFVVFSSRLTPVLVSNSHAAVVARGMGKPAVVGCGALNINYERQQMAVDGKVIHEGDFITLDGATGEVMLGEIPTIPPQVGGKIETLLGWADQIRRLGVRANADTPEDAAKARELGADGVGLCRTEHMFFSGDRILAVRQMILADNAQDRRAALDRLEPMQREDFAGIFKAMGGQPVTIRTLDPPLHEFLPHTREEMNELARDIDVDVETIRVKTASLREANPMLGHRGCRLGITAPEITEMQARAIFGAALDCTAEGIEVEPEIMIPLISDVKELELQRAVVDRVAEEMFAEAGRRVPYLVGTMIELPRAALTADKIAEQAEFFSYGTNDLTQTALGLSRDDAGRFLPIYVAEGIYPFDPFQRIDEEGVGALIEIATERGRRARPGMKLGICGEHGGDPASVDFCDRVGLDYVSCSPYRVPIARLAAAHAAIERPEGDK